MTATGSQSSNVADLPKAEAFEQRLAQVTAWTINAFRTEWPRGKTEDIAVLTSNCTPGGSETFRRS